MKRSIGIAALAAVVIAADFGVGYFARHELIEPKQEALAYMCGIIYGIDRLSQAERPESDSCKPIRERTRSINQALGVELR